MDTNKLNIEEILSVLFVNIFDSAFFQVTYVIKKKFGFSSLTID